MLLVIIVDDEVNNYYVIEKAVQETNGCITFHAHSSRSFFKLIKRVVPDFIFLKGVMPGPDSLYCLRKLRSIKKYNSVPVIMYSTGIICKREAYKNKANLYITRPDCYQSMSVVVHSILTHDWKKNLYPAVESLEMQLEEVN